MPVPVISIAQMREWEQVSWDAGRSVDVVMREAGRTVANEARFMTRPDEPVLVLTGKGNNGGDAKYAAEYLDDRKVALIDASRPGGLLDELPNALADIRARNGIVIDGLFGIGLNRPLEGHWRKLIEELNRADVRVLAVDVPSGLNADTGELMGVAVCATTTVTFGGPKNAMIWHKTAEHIGRLVVAAEIGLVACPFSGSPNWSLEQDFHGFPPRRPVHGHKSTFGHLAILAGSQGYHGAAVLAARAAHRAMPGLVSVFTPPPAYPFVASQLQQSMVHPWSGEIGLPDSTTAIVIGPGLAGPDLNAELRSFAVKLWTESELTVIADASALDWLPADVSFPGCRIVTPHPGEAARMLQMSGAEIQADREKAAGRLRERVGGCVVVLKGQQTVIADDQGITINSTGCPELGQGGSGDVLAGYLGGLAAQPALSAELPRTIRYAVWEHGRVAEQLSAERTAWDLNDLIPRLGNARGG